MAVVMDYESVWPPSVENEWTVVMAVSKDTAKVVEEYDTIGRFCVVKHWQTVIGQHCHVGWVLISSGWRGAPASNNLGAGYTPPRALLKELADWLSKDAEKLDDWEPGSEACKMDDAAREIRDRLDVFSRSENAD